MSEKNGMGSFGRGQGRNAGQGRRGGAVGEGPAGYCVCPKCGEKVKHIAGTPCTAMKCPKCESFLLREGVAEI